MTSYSEKPIIITLHIEPLKTAKGAFVKWQAKFNSKFVACPGMSSLEFLSPTSQHCDWLVVQRFTSRQDADKWRLSSDYLELLNELKRFTSGIRETTSDTTDGHVGSTEIFFTKIVPEKNEAFREWSAKIHQAEASFPGFRGVYLQAPTAEKDFWITLLQFDSIENLDRWLNSHERKVLLEEAASIISSLETNRIISPYAGWFSSLVKVGELPPVWKQTMLVLLVLFPIVMLEIRYLLPWLVNFNLSLSTFIGNAISVALISFPLMPIAIWFLSWWLLPKSRFRRKWTVLGFILICILYLLEIAIFWR